MANAAHTGQQVVNLQRSSSCCCRLLIPEDVKNKIFFSPIASYSSYFTRVSCVCGCAHRRTRVIRIRSSSFLGHSHAHTCGFQCSYIVVFSFIRVLIKFFFNNLHFLYRIAGNFVFYLYLFVNFLNFTYIIVDYPSF